MFSLSQFKLFPVFIKLVNDTRQLPLFISIMIVVNLAQLWYSVELTKLYAGNTSSLTSLMIAAITVPLVNFLYNSVNSWIITPKIGSEFSKQSYDQYSRLTFNCKNRIDIDNFRNKQGQAQYAILWSGLQGFDTVCQLMTTVYMVMVLFYTTGNTILLIISCLFYGSVYHFVLNRINTKSHESRTKAMDTNESIFYKLQLLLPKFNQGQKSSSDIVAEMDTGIKTDAVIEVYDCLSNSCITAFDKVVMCGICIYTTTDIIGLIAVASEFSSAIRSLLNFFKHINRHITDYNNYVKMFDGATYADMPIQYQFPRTGLTITDASIPIKDTDQCIALTPNLDITITSSSKILIIGDSGSGKTTFINALCGRIDGITLSVGVPSNYFSLVAEAHQKIRETISTIKLSVRQIFDNEPSDDLIRYCLEQVCLGDWLSKFEAVHLEPGSTIPLLDSVFDKPFENSASGGEANRLAVAMVLHQVIKPGSTKRIAIFDEPEQGSGVSQGYQLVTNLVNICHKHGCATIMVTHLSEAHRLAVGWSQIIKFKDCTIRELQTGETPFDLNLSLFV